MRIKRESGLPVAKGKSDKQANKLTEGKMESKSLEIRTDIYVTYMVAGAASLTPESSIVPVPKTTAPVEIPAYIRAKLRPIKAPDPSDGYRGQSPSQIIILNKIKLSNQL